MKISPLFPGPIYSHLAIWRPRAAGDAVTRALPAPRNLDRWCAAELGDLGAVHLEGRFLLLDALTPEIPNLTDPTQEHEQSVEHAWDESKIQTLIY